MPQMVLPQTPAPGMQKEASPGKSGSNREPDGESRYESVSRAEQKRADRQRAEARDDTYSRDKAAASSEKPASDREATVSSVPKESKPGARTDPANTTSANAEASEAGAQLAGEEVDVTATPLTFAELQALLIPGASQTAASATGGGGAGNAVAGPLNALMPTNGVIAGKPGHSGQGVPGLASGLQLTDALAGTLGSESGRPAEPTSLMASARFQSALDVAGQQAPNTGAGKLAAETAVPLKSYATSIDTPVGQAEWGDKLVGKLSWLTARNMSVAEIHLTPPDMGPMEVKVRVQNEHASITVHAANPVVRDQLELHSHRLRDMLGEQGLNLARFDVSDSPQQGSGEQGPGDEQDSGSGNASGTLAAADADEVDGRTGNLDLSWTGEVDIFA